MVHNRERTIVQVVRVAGHFYSTSFVYITHSKHYSLQLKNNERLRT